jgi:hypothetical protein
MAFITLVANRTKPAENSEKNGAGCWFVVAGISSSKKAFQHLNNSTGLGGKVRSTDSRSSEPEGEM